MVHISSAVYLILWKASWDQENSFAFQSEKEPMEKNPYMNIQRLENTTSSLKSAFERYAVLNESHSF